MCLFIFEHLNILECWLSKTKILLINLIRYEKVSINYVTQKILTVWLYSSVTWPLSRLLRNIMCTLHRQYRTLSPRLPGHIGRARRVTVSYATSTTQTGDKPMLDYVCPDPEYNCFRSCHSNFEPVLHLTFLFVIPHWSLAL